MVKRIMKQKTKERVREKASSKELELRKIAEEYLRLKQEEKLIQAKLEELKVKLKEELKDKPIITEFEGLKYMLILSKRERETIKMDIARKFLAPEILNAIVSKSEYEIIEIKKV